MKLLTKEIESRLPKLYKTEDIPCEGKPKITIRNEDRKRFTF